jgi:hypothetical protein
MASRSPAVSMTIIVEIEIMISHDDDIKVKLAAFVVLSMSVSEILTKVSFESNRFFV